MTNNGGASINLTRPLIRNGGINVRLGVELLEKTQADLENLENRHPNKKVKDLERKLSEVKQNMAIGIRAISKGNGEVVRGAGKGSGRSTRPVEASGARVMQIEGQGIGIGVVSVPSGAEGGQPEHVVLPREEFSNSSSTGPPAMRRVRVRVRPQAPTAAGSRVRRAVQHAALPCRSST